MWWLSLSNSFFYYYIAFFKSIKNKNKNKNKTEQRFFFCLSSSCVLWAQCWQCLYIVQSCLPFRFSLTFLKNNRNMTVSLVEQELLTIPEHLCTSPVLRDSYYSIFNFLCCVSTISLFVVLSFFHHCTVCSSISSFWLHFRYLFVYNNYLFLK